MAWLPDDKALNHLCDHLNRRWWGGQLPKIPVRWSRRMHAIAGKYWRSKRGWEIVLSLLYHQRYPKELEGILKHEMIHVWLHKKGMWQRRVAHGAEFQREAKRVGAPLYCKSYDGIHRPYKYAWECPQCRRRSLSRVQRVWACGPCCRKYNKGKYSAWFQLRLVDQTARS